jgi:hypothetical protein
MLARLSPAALVLAATIADARGGHTLAFYLLLAAVPAGAAAALGWIGELVDLPAGEHGLRRHVLLAASAVVLTVAAASLHGHATVPPVGVSALVGALLLYGVQTVLVVAATGRVVEARPVA